uniref:DM13 domain-containing protein n=1 Tax=Strongyloides stercoralis TaxID=6248 RepID=A0A0K0EFC0_STRER
MYFKILSILIIFYSLSVTVEGSLGYASTSIGKTFKFDFGPETKSLRISRNDTEEILLAGKGGLHPNVKLSNAGILTISPVTKNDFGMYSAMYKIEHQVGNTIIGVAPPAIILTEEKV